MWWLRGREQTKPVRKQFETQRGILGLGTKRIWIDSIPIVERLHNKGALGHL